MLTQRLALLLLALPLLFCACEDKDKQVIGKIGPVFEETMPLIERDTKQVREGLPKGAQKLAEYLDEDPGGDPEGLQRAIQNARAAVHDLAVAKSSFFIFVNPEGVVVRSEEDPDLAAGESLVKAIPEAKTLVAPDAKAVREVFGSMHGLRGYEKGEDLQWVIGHPVRGKDGEHLGAFVTGWSLRRYANYLELHARNHLEQIAEDKTKPTPLLYLFVVKGDRAYGGKLTPEVSADKLSGLGLVEKAKAGEFREKIDVEGREFFVSAKPAPSLGDDVALAILMSPV